MELIYTSAYFGSIVLVYRVIVDSQLGPLTFSSITKTVVPAFVFFSGVVIFIVLRLPDSLEEPTWVQVRGVIAGFLLSVTLTAGMLM